MVIVGVFAWVVFTKPWGIDLYESALASFYFVYGWLLSSQVTWLPLVIGVSATAIVALTGHRVWVAIKNFGYKKTVAPLNYIPQVQPSYSAQSVAQNPANPATTNIVPEEKK